MCPWENFLINLLYSIALNTVTIFGTNGTQYTLIGPLVTLNITTRPNQRLYIQHTIPQDKAFLLQPLLTFRSSYYL